MCFLDYDSNVQYWAGGSSLVNEVFVYQGVWLSVLKKADFDLVL